MKACMNGKCLKDSYREVDWCFSFSSSRFDTLYHFSSSSTKYWAYFTALGSANDLKTMRTVIHGMNEGIIKNVFENLKRLQIMPRSKKGHIESLSHSY